MNSLRALVAGATLSACALSSACSFTTLADLPGNPVNCQALGLSANGDVVVGFATPQNVNNWGYPSYWINADEAVQLDFGGPGEANGVSSSGQIIVGRVGPTAAKWSNFGTYQDLGDLAGGPTISVALGCSASGSVIVGYGFGSSGQQQPVVWQNGGVFELPPIPGGTRAGLASNVSANGRVIVGVSLALGGTNEAFRCVDGITQGLGDLPGGPVDSIAYDVSGDGSVVVGMSRSENGPEAFVWTQVAGMVALGDLPGGAFSSFATGVSDDGRVVVGYSAVEGDYDPFVWTEQTGMIPLREYLLARGLVGVTGWRLHEVTDISANGRVICGKGTPPGSLSDGIGWVARIEEPGDTLPTSFTVNEGYVFDGSVADLKCSDNAYVRLFPDEVSLGCTVTIAGTSPLASAGSLRVVLETSVARPGLAQVSSLRNYGSLTYTVFDGRVAPLSDFVVDRAISGPNSYIGPSNALRLRIQWYPINDEDPAQDGWTHDIDRACWYIN